MSRRDIIFTAWDMSNLKRKLNAGKTLAQLIEEARPVLRGQEWTITGGVISVWIDDSHEKEK